MRYETQKRQLREDIMKAEGVDRGIRITNDLTRTKEQFIPISGNRVNMYVCGVTVYDECHIGHARAYVCFDMVRRYLEYKGYEVYYIQNFTDIDDKIIARAKERNVGIREMTEGYIENYFEVMDALGVKRASVYPRATEYVDKMIGVVERLVERGHAYEAKGSVFFDVSSFPDYGKMSNVDLSEKKMTAEDREIGKRNAADFALWKAAKEDEPFWESPWGRGRPGWHIECSTMSTALAGPTLDIHGGGHDLIFPHHENEIAQAECYTGEKFVRVWMHNGFVEMGSEKMSKSLGNTVAAKDLLKSNKPDAVRLFFLSAHYRMPIAYGEDRIAESGRGVERFGVFFSKIDDMKRRASGSGTRASAEVFREKIESARKGFVSSMDDDFNTPGAIAEIFSLVRSGNTWISELEVEGGGVSVDEAGLLEESRGAILEMGGALGLFQDYSVGAETADAALIEPLLRKRNEARARKDWKTSDEIREELARLGFVVEDGPFGTSWRRK